MPQPPLFPLPPSAGTVTPGNACAALLALLAPLYTPHQVLAASCESAFRRRLVARIMRDASCDRRAATAALRRAGLLP